MNHVNHIGNQNRIAPGVKEIAVTLVTTATERWRCHSCHACRGFLRVGIKSATEHPAQVARMAQHFGEV